VRAYHRSQLAEVEQLEDLGLIQRSLECPAGQ